jgi:pimeloyl-ACP methyl ester carboxylesterase
MEDREKVQVRVHGIVGKQTLVYLPGVHGDWTLVGGFRRALADRVRFVEIGYPLGVHWTISEYAVAIVRELANRRIASGWLLAESFGSQVAWEITRQTAFRTEGIILAGGFVRHPMPMLAGLACAITGNGSFHTLRAALAVYSQVARFRFGRSPEMLAEIQEFVARRTEADFHSGRHRLVLIARHDPRQTVMNLRIPIFALSGFFDPIVPWRSVRKWMERNCSSFREHSLIWRADHNVLGTAPKAAADQVLSWIFTQPEPDRR